MSAYAERRIKARYDRALTDTEMRVVDLVVIGLGNIPIAISMRTSEQVIKNKLNIIFVKLGVTSRTQLIVKILGERHRGKPPVTEVGEAGYNHNSSLNVQYPAMIRKPKRPEQP